MILPLTAASAWVLTSDGYGPARIGMTRTHVERAIGSRLGASGPSGDDDCEERRVPGVPGAIFMFEDGRLARVTLVAPSRSRTPRRIGIGSTRSAVERAYPGIGVAEHEYEEGLGSRSLLYWIKPEVSGVRFLTNRRGRVEAIHAGGHNITYIEGCL